MIKVLFCATETSQILPKVVKPFVNIKTDFIQKCKYNNLFLVIIVS